MIKIFSLFANCNTLLVPNDLWNFTKSDCSELLTILLRQHWSADDLWPLLHQHLSADNLGNPHKIYYLKSSQNLPFEILMTSTLRGVPSQGRYWVTACCDLGELKGSHLGSLFIGSHDDWLWSMHFHSGHNSCQVILAPSKVGHDPSSRSFSYGSRQQEIQVWLGSA